MPRYEARGEKAVCDYLSTVMEKDAVSKMHLFGGGAVAALEKQIKLHYGKKYALCVSNATVGLLAIAMALELKNSDFVTTSYTYGATISGWLLAGNRPIFADIDASTLTLNCESVRESITPKTKAILVSDIYGIPHDLVGLRKIADEFGLWYISDSAQSLGASRDSLPAGALADSLVVSFTVGKTVFAGEGAAIVTDNAELYQKMIWLTQHPMRQKRELGLALSNEFGLNARIHPLAAVWANATMEDSLNQLKEYQNKCFRIIDVLNETGLTENIDFASRRINPTFFRLTASWKNKKKNEPRLLKILKAHGFRKCIEMPPVNLIYQQPAFLAQYAKHFVNKAYCFQAERQARSRFCLS